MLQSPSWLQFQQKASAGRHCVQQFPNFIPSVTLVLVEGLMKTRYNLVQFEKLVVYDNALSPIPAPKNNFLLEEYKKSLEFCSA